MNGTIADIYRLDAADDWDGLPRIAELQLSSFQPADGTAARTMRRFA
jgi:hypothetical protein